MSSKSPQLAYLASASAQLLYLIPLNRYPWQAARPTSISVWLVGSRRGSTKAMMRRHRFFALVAALIVSAVLIPPCICAAQTPQRADSLDVLIKNGMVYDGTGQPPRDADVGIRGDRIV